LLSSRERGEGLGMVFDGAVEGQGGSESCYDTMMGTTAWMGRHEVTADDTKVLLALLILAEMA